MIYHRTFSLAVSKVKQSNSKAEDVLYSQRNEVRAVFFFLVTSASKCCEPKLWEKISSKEAFCVLRKVRGINYFSIRFRNPINWLHIFKKLLGSFYFFFQT